MRQFRTDMASQAENMKTQQSEMYDNQFAVMSALADVMEELLMLEEQISNITNNGGTK